MQSRFLLFSAVSLGSGCAVEVDTTDLITREEMDAAISAAVTSASDAAQAYADLGDAALTAVDATLSGSIADLELADTTLSESIADLELANGDVVQILRDDAGTGTVTWNIDADGTGDFATVEDAIAALDDYHIPADLLLEIKLAPGDYEFYAPLEFHHPDGGQIRLVGDEAAPETVTMSFPYSSGIFVSGGSALGYLAGVSMYGSGASGTYGILVYDNSSVVLGRLILDTWYYGLEAWSGSFVRGEHTAAADSRWLSVRNSTSHGLYAAASSGFWLPNAESIGSGGDGVHLDWGSAAYMPAAFATNNVEVGFSAYGGSYLDANGATAENNDRGFQVWLGSAAQADNAISDNNVGTGFSSALASYIYAESPVVRGSNAAFHTAAVAGLTLLSPSVTGTTGTAYSTYAHAFMYVDSPTGDITADTAQNDTTDFIYGL